MRPCIDIVPASPAILHDLHAVIERAYRGDSARVGWTHEADLVTGPRIDTGTLQAILASPTDRLLVAMYDGVPVGCVQITATGSGAAYLGLLCVDPQRQADGIGGRLIAAGEAYARDVLRAHRLEMTVISTRSALIAYYTRRGYRPTGENRAFPIPLVPPLTMAVLTKEIAS